MYGHFLAVAGRNPRAFLASMLECVIAVIRHFSGIDLAKDAEDAAVVFRMVCHAGGIQSFRGAKRKGILMGTICGGWERFRTGGKFGLQSFDE
jgi:hypothetical protein